MALDFESLPKRAHAPMSAEAETKATATSSYEEEVKDVLSFPVVPSGEGSPGVCRDEDKKDGEVRKRRLFKKEPLPGSNGGWRWVRITIAESECELTSEQLHVQRPPPKMNLCDECDPEERVITSKVDSGLSPKQRLSYMTRCSKSKELHGHTTSKRRKHQATGAALVAAVPASIQQRRPAKSASSPALNSPGVASQQGAPPAPGACAEDSSRSARRSVQAMQQALQRQEARETGHEESATGADGHRVAQAIAFQHPLSGCLGLGKASEGRWRQVSIRQRRRPPLLPTVTPGRMPQVAFAVPRRASSLQALPASSLRTAEPTRSSNCVLPLLKPSASVPSVCMSRTEQHER